MTDVDTTEPTVDEPIEEVRADENTYDLIDISIREQIIEGRRLHDACTARWVASQLHISPDVVRHRLMKMSNEGTVRWNDMPGSLIVVETAVEEAAAEEVAPVGEEGADEATEQPSQDQPPASPRPSVPRKRSAKRPASGTPARASAPAKPRRQSTAKK